LPHPGRWRRWGRRTTLWAIAVELPGAASRCCAALRVPAPNPAALSSRSLHRAAARSILARLVLLTATLLCVMRGMLCPGNVSHRLASACDGGDYDRQPAEALRLAGRRPCHQRSGLGEAVECALVQTRASKPNDAHASARIATSARRRRWASDSRARNVRTLAPRTHVESGSASTADAAAGIPLVRWRACQVPDLQVEYQKGSFACLYPCAWLTVCKHPHAHSPGSKWRNVFCVVTGEILGLSPPCGLRVDALDRALLPA
jgi:hypothetical protein